MKTASKRRRGGYTLVELTLVIGTGMVIAALLLSLVNQQLSFLRIFRTQGFLVAEAPMLNNFLSRIVTNADSYRLYDSVGDLVSGAGGHEGQVMADAPVILLRFKEPDGTFRAAVLSFEDPGTGLGLYYRLVNRSGVLGDPSWALSKQPSDVRFSIEQGVLRVRITGPNGEQLVYSGAMQL